MEPGGKLPAKVEHVPTRERLASSCMSGWALIQGQSAQGSHVLLAAWKLSSHQQWLQVALSRSCVYALGPDVSIIEIIGASGVATGQRERIAYCKRVWGYGDLFET